MIGMKLDAAKGLFFDRARVTNAVDRTTRKNLSRFGAFVRKRARTSILIFEVMGWRYSDPYRRTYRIETKHVGTENV